MRQRFKNSIAEAKSIAEIKSIFSDTARTLIAEMLEGNVTIAEDAIQLVTENGGAIFIEESLTDNAAFKKICHDTPCISILKSLAEIALSGKDTESTST